MIDRFEHFSSAIFEISRYWHKIAAKEMTRYGLKGPHATYLTVMARYEQGITVPKLCEICNTDTSATPRMIDIPAQKGLVRKEGGKSQYRGLLFLTEEGRKAADEVCRKAAQVVEIAGKDLDDEKRAILYESLDSIVANLRKLNEEGVPEV